MDLLTLALAAVLVAVCFIFRRQNDKLRGIPGPFRLPILGNVQFKFKSLHHQFSEFAERFGDVYRIQILTQSAIVINSYAAYKEAYLKKGKDFIGRPHMLRFEVMKADRGIGFRVS